MKNRFQVIIIFAMLIFVNSIYAQGYFVAGTGTYISAGNFKTNVQSDISKYEGRYIAASETYESNDELIIAAAGDVLNITIISGATMDGGDNWMMDTLVFRNVSVSGGMFTINNDPVYSGNTNFRFVNGVYKQDGKNVKAEGIVLEEYKMFAEKEK